MKIVDSLSLASMTFSKLGDGIGFVLRLRVSAVQEFTLHLERVERFMREKGHGPVYQWLWKFCSMFGRQSSGYGLTVPERRELDEMEKNLLWVENFGESVYSLPVMVNSNIKPTNPHRFLIHILLC